MRRTLGRLASAATAVLTAALLLASSGCVKFTLDTTIHPDGSGKRTIDMGLDPQLSELLKIRGGFNPEELKKELLTNLPPDAKLRTYTSDGSTHYATAFEFRSVAELNRTTQGASRRRGAKAPSVALRRDEGLLYTTYTFTENLPPSSVPLTSEETSLAKDFAVEYRLTLPGKIASSNADRLADTSTGVWKVNLTKGRLVKATSQAIRWPLIAAFALIAVVAVVAGIVVLVIWSLRRRAGAAETKVEP